MPVGGAVRGVGAGDWVVMRVVVRCGGSGGGSDGGSGVPPLLRLEPVGDGFYLLIRVVPGVFDALSCAADGPGRQE